MSLFSRLPRIQLSLRTVFVLFLFTCVLVGLFIQWHQRTLIQQGVIRQLRQRPSPFWDSGGQSFNGVACFYDYQITDDPIEQRLFDSDPSWLARIFGIDRVHSLKRIEFSRNVDCEDCELIGRLGYVTELELLGGIAEPSDWACLFSLTSLTKLTVRMVSPIGLARDDSAALTNRLERISNLSHLTELHLHEPALSESEWLSILRHPVLKVLELNDLSDTFPIVSSREQSASKVENLYFPRCGASTETVSSVLTQTPSLKLLSLDVVFSNSPLSDQIFEPISKLSKLEALAMYRTAIKGHTLHLLEKLPIKKLVIGMSNVDDQGLDCLIGFHRLEYLEVGSTKITDRGMKPLAQLPNLEYLSIRNTAVTDRGLMELSRLKRLKVIRVRDTRISSKGIEAFRRAIPECKVDFN